MVAGQGVVEQDHRPAMPVQLDPHEIAQCRLEQVEPVDERQVDRRVGV
jgi:hypothetical protein